jgi:Collagen triple helix repeat (20 copies)
MSNLISRRATAGLATAGALLLGALAAAPQAGAQPVYVCQKVGSTFHVVTSKQKCKKGETKLSLGVSSGGAMGMVGATGAAGVTGAVGAAGPAGPAGPVGAVGATGPAGAPGAAANAGATGAKGVTGEVGAKGATGGTGATGPTGATGAAAAPLVVEKGEATIAAVKEPTATELEPPEFTTAKVITTPCPANTVLISGGFESSGTAINLLKSAPSATAGAWEYVAENRTTSAPKLTAYADCLSTK